jgi:hypothetical protein
MVGRREFGVLGLSAAAALALKSAVAAQKDAAKDDAHGQHAAFMKCANACNDCQRECDTCSNHCAQMLAEGKKDHLRSLKTCQDCADFCAAAAQMVARHGPFSALICEACEKACDKCAAECEKFKSDEHMARCAEECRKCQKACKEMFGHIGHG